MSLVLLPLAGCFDSGTYYAARSVLYRHLGEGSSFEDIGLVMTASSVASLGGTVLAGLVAIGTGPWILAIVGAGTLLVATAFLGVVPAEFGAMGAVLLGFGHGMTRTALLGAGARAFPDFRTENLRNAVCFGIYGAANLVSLTVSEAAGRIAEEVGTGPVFLGGLVATFPLLAIVIGLAVAVWITREQKDELTEPPARDGVTHVVVVGVVLLVSGIVWALWSSGFDLVFELAQRSGGGYEMQGSLLAMNPVLVSAGCVLGFLVSVGLHFGKVRVPTLLPIGMGLVLISASLVALLSADTVDDGIVRPAVVILALGEVLAAPLVLSRIMGDLPKRLPTIAIAVFYLISTTPMLLVRMIDGELEVTRAMAALGAASAGIAGFGFVVAAVLLFRVLHPDPGEPKEF